VLRCGHCKRLAPVLEDVAGNDTHGVHFAKVDCTTEQSMCREWGVKGYPMLILVQGQTKWVYKGPRRQADIEQMLARMHEPPVRQVSTEAQLAEMKDSNPVCFILAHDASAADARTASALGNFTAAARALQHTDCFGAASEPKVIRSLMDSKPLQASALPLVARVEDGEDVQLMDASEVVDEKAIQEYVAAKRVPTLSLINNDNFGMLANAGKPLAVLLVDPKTFAKEGEAPHGLTLDDSAHGIGAELRELARDPAMNSRFVFAMLDAADYEEFLKTEYELELRTMPRMLVLWRATRMSSFYIGKEGEASNDASIRAFLERVYSGEEEGELEGNWGRPARIWRTLTKYAPFLHALDGLPRFTFVGMFGLLFIYGIYRVCSWVPEGDFYDMDEEERLKLAAKKKS
jgi:thiol-disulfide isomerase/thioredoxin